LASLLSNTENTSGTGEFTYVAPANVSSIILDFVSRDKTAKKHAVEAIMMRIRARTPSTRTQMTTGVSRRAVITNSIRVAAMFLISEPEYM